MSRRPETRRRPRGHIRQRGSSYGVFAGTDPVTGKRNYRAESTRDAK